MFGRELNILFWNLNRKELHYPLAVMAKEQRADIIIVAEAENLDTEAFLWRLNTLKSEYYDANEFSLSERILFFTKFDPSHLQSIREDKTDRYVFRLLTLPTLKQLIIGGVHLPDQFHYTKSSRKSFATDVKNELERIEEELEIKNTFIVGDFNMNPFEDGMFHTDGFNAVSSKSLALKLNRVVFGRKYSYFYNPSWSLMGDLYEEPPGTFFYNQSGYDSYSWNVLDQLIMRPSLIENFDNQSYKIITRFAATSLLTAGERPNKNKYSDHLPVRVTFQNL